MSDPTLRVQRRVIRQGLVPEHLTGERIDRVAAALFNEFSRSALSKWISQGDLKVDGTAVKPKTRVFAGSELKIDADPMAAERWEVPQAVDFTVIFEDKHLLVVNKPAGLVVHPGAGNIDGTLVNGLLHYRADLAALPRAGIVHRLDKDTSGLLIIAGSLSVHDRLVKSIADRTVTREYLAIAEGRMTAGQNVEQPIGRHPKDRTRQTIRSDGKWALTRLRVEERFRAHTLVRARLATGRTHQIRVHMSSIGHSLVGDSRYGARGIVASGMTSAVREHIQTFPRQALHATHLAFAHPVSEERLSFEVPLPADMEALLASLREDAQEAID